MTTVGIRYCEDNKDVIQDAAYAYASINICSRYVSMILCRCRTRGGDLFFLGFHDPNLVKFKVVQHIE